MVRDALWLEMLSCKDFKCSFLAKAYITFTASDGISVNTYKETEGIFGLEVLSGLSGLSLYCQVKHSLESSMGTRWKLLCKL